MFNCASKEWAKASSLIVRLPLGLFFLLAGVAKVSGDAGVAGFVETVKSFEILPDSLATVYGYVLPYAEIVVGAAAIVGFWTPLAGLLMSLMLLSFVIATGVKGGGGPFNKDIILLASAVYLWWNGSKFWSIDGMKK